VVEMIAGPPVRSAPPARVRLTRKQGPPPAGEARASSTAGGYNCVISYVSGMQNKPKSLLHKQIPETILLSTIHKPPKTPVILSSDEMARFLEAAPGIKYKAAFSVAYGAGLRVSEVASLKVSDIDSQPMMLRIEQGTCLVAPQPATAQLAPMLPSPRNSPRSSPTHRLGDHKNASPFTGISILTAQPTLAADLGCGPPTAKSP
jgi:hypothetical protein